MEYNRGVTSLAPWGKGLCNKTSARGLQDGSVRNAVNVDFITDTILRRRKGLTKVYSGIGLSNGFSCPVGSFFVEGTTLKRLNADNTATEVYIGVTGEHHTFFYKNGVVYFSDGTLSLKLTDSTVYKWGMDVPAAPVVYGASGTFPAGVYLTACCFVDHDGVESGASRIESIYLTENSGVTFTNIPLITDPQVATVRLYMSTADGGELFHVADTTAPEYTIVAGTYAEGATLESKFISPAPGARVVAYYNGRAYVADGVGAVHYSEPFEYDRFKIGSNFLQFPSAVDIMIPVDTGIFFAYGSTTEFYAGNPEDGFNIVPKFEYGGVLGSAKQVPNSSSVIWQSQRGTILGTADGQCKNIQEDTVAIESADSAATMVREREGVRHFVTSLRNPVASPMAAQSWIDAEVIRRG